MKLKKVIVLLVTHAFVGFLGFAAGIYTLPILTAPKAPTKQELSQASVNSLYQAGFSRDLKGSDALHWGDGLVSISAKAITFSGELASGPDYKLYLSPEFVETEADFKRLKEEMVVVGDVKTFDSFIVKLPTDVDPANFTSVIVWCESFGQFITAAKYR